MSVFEQRFDGLGQWQAELSSAIEAFAGWLQNHDHVDRAAAERFARLRHRLSRREISVAFVAEFSRGKSELINALFFSGYGQRVMPSAAGRTTMCPAELRWDPAEPTGVRLLPIATREDDRPLESWRSEPEAWVFKSFDASDVSSLKSALASVAEADTVDVAKARALGLADDEAPPAGTLEVPRWRHAIINFEHPLLAAGLTIIDTPGLNAIGSEPTLTLNTIPNADAVLFLLAADAGVTRSDIDVWRRYISPSHRSGRLVVLNKVDGLWDDLKSDEQVEAEIAGQVASVSEALGVGQERVFALSAQKALVARVHRDEPLLARSGIVALETALADAVVPQRQSLLAEFAERELRELTSAPGEVLRQRVAACEAQLGELEGLRGKNRDIMTHMASRVRIERDEFDRSLRQLAGLRSVFGRHSESLRDAIGTARLKRHARESRDMMSESKLSLGLNEGMNHLFKKVAEDLDAAADIVREIGTMMVAMYRTFSNDHGLKLGSPLHFSLKRFRAEIAGIEALYRAQFGTSAMVTTEKWSLMKRFFETIVLRVREVYRQAGSDIDVWLGSVMAPVEAQVREYQRQLKRRLDSVRRILEANGSLEERIDDIDGQRQSARAELLAYENLLGEVRRCQRGNDAGSGHDVPAGDVALLV